MSVATSTTSTSRKKGHAEQRARQKDATASKHDHTAATSLHPKPAGLEVDSLQLKNWFRSSFFRGGLRPGAMFRVCPRLRPTCRP